MVLEHESISDNVDTHFLQVIVSQQWCELASDFVLLEGFEIVAQSPLSKIRAELSCVPSVIIGEMIEIPAFIGHCRVMTAGALHLYLVFGEILRIIVAMFAM